MHCGAGAPSKKQRIAGYFCSDKCRQKYFDESNRLAMERLMQQRQASSAAKPAPELPPPPGAPPPAAGFIPELLSQNIESAAPPLGAPDWEESPVTLIWPGQVAAAPVPTPSEEPLPPLPVFRDPAEFRFFALEAPARIVVPEEPALPEPRQSRSAAGWLRLPFRQERQNPPLPAPVVSPEPQLPTGLDAWRTEWTSDDLGNPRGRQLILYTPSRRMRDCALEFALEAGASATWVLRAQDAATYYLFRLIHLAGGSLTFQRSAVLRNTAEAPAELAVPSQGSPALRIRAEACGALISTYFNGRLLDSWTDDRIARGAAGFVKEQNDRPAITAVQFTFAIPPPFGVVGNFR